METLMAKWQAFVTKCHTYFLTKVGFLTLPASEMFTEDPPSIHQLGKKGTLETTMPMIFFLLVCETKMYGDTKQMLKIHT